MNGPSGNTVHVNFGKPFPLLPLEDVTLLPQQVLPLQIFEPRYRQMIANTLDESGQVAMAVFRGDRWKQEYHGSPPLKPAVCIGQIVQHEKLPDGRYFILLQGVCRARITAEIPPGGEEPQRLYRLALLEPIGEPTSPGTLIDGSPRLIELRRSLESMLSHSPLKDMTHAGPVLEYVRKDEVPTTALLELISFTLLNNARLRYRLLEEGDVDRRAAMIETELRTLAALIDRARAHHDDSAPKGCSWN